MNKRRRGCGLTLLVAACLISGAGAAIAVMTSLERGHRAEQLDKVLNGGPPIRPVWLRQAAACVPADEYERERDLAMVRAARASLAGRLSPDFLNPVLHYAIKYFSWHWKLMAVKRCRPDQTLIDQLLPALEATNWPFVNTQAAELALVERMQIGSRLAHALGKIAFAPGVPPREVAMYDSRPYARMLLGDQEQFARPWAERARSEIDPDTKLGTSAAYLAVASDPGAALPLVKDAMSAKLDQSLRRQVRAYSETGETDAIRPGDADRLIELAYALGRAGQLADGYTDPLLRTLDHGFARGMPPFGLGVANATELCRVAAWIGGRTASIAQTKRACRESGNADGSPSEIP